MQIYKNWALVELREKVKLISKVLIIIFAFMFFCCGCTTKDERTVVQFSSWGSKSEIDILRPMLVDFERENPDI